MNNEDPLRNRIGIIGGGQLGRMMIEESLRLNINFNVLDEAGCPASALATRHIVGDLLDARAIRNLAAISDIITYEIEHINVDVLLELEKEGKKVIPPAAVLQVIQDKGLQKQFFADNNIPTSKFMLVDTPAQWWDALNEFSSPKLVAKTRKNGYDGKGVSIFNVDEIRNNPSLIPFSTPTVIEDFVACEKEISVMVARGIDGEITTWPVAEMEFDPQANLVTFLDCPASLSEQTEAKAREIALHTIEALNGYGVFAVEMFIDNTGTVLVNEIAPRPHNSGHHTIEACYTSQFEQLVRILAGLPLGSTSLIKPAVMINLLGPADVAGPYHIKGLAELSAMEGVYLHLYGKKETRPMRKMGHITVLANTLAEARQKAISVNEIIQFLPYSTLHSS